MIHTDAFDELEEFDSISGKPVQRFRLQWIGWIVAAWAAVALLVSLVWWIV
jgi:hypothetical protein